MANLIRTEWLKEKRSANKKMFLAVPIIFIGFSILMSLVMGGVAYGKNYLVVTAYNWFPLLILPIFISLMACNSLEKEKRHHNQGFYRSLNISTGKMYLSKIAVVTGEFALILLMAFVLLLLIGKGLFHDANDYVKVFLATIYLFVGSLPLIPISFLLFQISNYFIVILTNFILSSVAAVAAVESWWFFFPWSYSLRMMAPSLGIHPNGTFLEANSYLWVGDVIPVALGLSLFFYLAVSGIIYVWMERSEKYA